MALLTWCLTNWRIILSIVAIVGSFIAGWSQGGDNVQRRWDVDIHIRTLAALEQMKANDALKTKLEETKNVNAKTIDLLAATVSKLRTDNRLRLPAPPCAGSLSDTTATGGSQDGAAASGVVSGNVQTAAEQAINDFDATYASEAERADKLIESCRVLRDWAKAQDK